MIELFGAFAITAAILVNQVTHVNLHVGLLGGTLLPLLAYYDFEGVIIGIGVFLFCLIFVLPWCIGIWVIRRIINGNSNLIL